MNRINTSTLDQWIARTRDATWAVSVERRNAHSLPGPYCKEITERPLYVCCRPTADIPSARFSPFLRQTHSGSTGLTVDFSRMFGKRNPVI